MQNGGQDCSFGFSVAEELVFKYFHSCSPHLHSHSLQIIKNTCVSISNGDHKPGFLRYSVTIDLTVSTFLS